MKNYNKNNKFHKNVISMIGICIMIINFIYLTKIQYISQIWFEEIEEKAGNLVDNYHRQTYAFANGSIAFLENTDTLKELENPYDINQRWNIDYLFDTSYYKGKYYSYYTAIPIVFILLPLYLITGKFLNLAIVNFTILMLAIYVAGKLYQFIIENYIKKIPFIFYILGFVTLIFGSNMLLLMRGLKYDIAVSCGILFITLTVYTLLSLSNKDRVKLKLIMAGIFMSFIVCSKPTYIVYYPLIFYITYKVWKKYRLNKKDIFYLILPIAIIAISQMMYNYVRYDSILEFGAKYQLTIFNLLDYIGFSWNRLWRGIQAYFFHVPELNLKQFPYLFMTRYDDNGQYDEFLYENFFVGLICFPAIIISIIYFFDMEPKSDEDFTMKRCLKILYVTYFALIIINTIYAGVAETYSIEAKFLLLFMSIICFLKYISIKSNITIMTIFAIACVLNILLIVPISYSGEELCFLNLINN